MSDEERIADALDPVPPSRPARRRSPLPDAAPAPSACIASIRAKRARVGYPWSGQAGITVVLKFLRLQVEGTVDPGLKLFHHLNWANGFVELWKDKL